MLIQAQKNLSVLLVLKWVLNKKINLIINKWKKIFIITSGKEFFNNKKANKIIIYISEIFFYSN